MFITLFAIVRVLIFKGDGTVKGQKEKKVKKKIVGDARTRTRNLEVGSQVRYRFTKTKTFPIENTRKRKMEFSNPTLQVKYEHDPGI